MRTDTLRWLVALSGRWGSSSEGTAGPKAEDVKQCNPIVIDHRIGLLGFSLC